MGDTSFGSQQEEAAPMGSSAAAESAANWIKRAAMLSSQSTQASAWASKTANEAVAAARNAVAQLVYLSDSMSTSPHEVTSSQSSIGQFVGVFGAAVTSASWTELVCSRHTS